MVAIADQRRLVLSRFGFELWLLVMILQLIVEMIGHCLRLCDGCQWCVIVDDRYELVVGGWMLVMVIVW